MERLSKALQERNHARVLAEIRDVFKKHRRKIPFAIEPFFIDEHMTTEDPVDIQFIIDVGDCMLEIMSETHEEVLCEAEA